MQYREELPCHYPPADAEEISGPSAVYRLIRKDAPAEEDFHSLSKLNPARKYSGLKECIACGLSVFTSSSAAKKRSVRRSSGYRVCKVRLERCAGKIKKTGRPEHYTWWPYRSFDILGCCELIDNG